jgi:hypothetical protein
MVEINLVIKENDDSENLTYIRVKNRRSTIKEIISALNKNNRIE